MIRQISALAVAWLIVSTALAQDDAKAVVRKAIDAHGGSQLLDKYPAAKVRSKGTMTFLGQMVPFESTATYQMPDKMKEVQTVQVAGIKKNVTQLQVGDQVRIMLDGVEMKIEDKDKPKYRQMIYVQNLYRLTPLLDDKTCKLSLVEDKTVSDRTAHGVKATAEGRQDVIFYFDKGTNMLVKTQRTGFDQTGAEAPMEEVFSVYKDVKGYMYPSKTTVYLRGKKFLESEVIEFLPLERFEPVEFEKP